MVALMLQQFQYNLKKNFLRRLVFPILFCQSDGPPHGGGGGLQRGGLRGGGGYLLPKQPLLVLKPPTCGVTSHRGTYLNDLLSEAGSTYRPCTLYLRPLLQPSPWMHGNSKSTPEDLMYIACELLPT